MTICSTCARPCTEKNMFHDILRQGEAFRFKKGQVLWRKGDSAENLVLVCTGVLKLAQQWAEDKEVILDLAHRGDVVGEASALPKGQHGYTATAITTGRGIRVPRARVQEALHRTPEATLGLLELSCQRIQSFTTRMEEVTRGAVPNRLARVLLRMGEEMGLQDSRGVFLPLHLSRNELAELVGCRVETTIRVMTKWQKDQVVETIREGFILRQPDRLEELARAAA